MKRNYLFDNLKALLIFLITIVHLLAPVRKIFGTDNIVLDTFLLSACAFHMPLFAYISGFFSKKLKWQKNSGILITYFVMQTILMVFNFICFNSTPSFSKLVIPGFSMWYILSLFVWRCILYKSLKIKYLWVWCVLLNIIPMYMKIDGAVDKTIIKTLNFYVFFLMGFSTDDEMLKKIRNVRKLYYVILLAGCIASLCLITETGFISVNILRSMMLRSVSVPSKLGYVKGYLIYVYLFALAVALSVSLINLFPEKAMWFSKWGRNTMTIYLGQAMVYLLWSKKMLKWDMFDNPLTAYLTAIALTILCCAVFGLDKVAIVFNDIIKTVQKFIFSKCIKIFYNAE